MQRDEYGNRLPPKYVYGKYSDGQREQTNRYNKENYDTITVRLYKGEKEMVKELVQAHGISVNAYLKNLIYCALDDFESYPREH
ncbi:MAG: DUF6290 family protein [Bacteroides sp.]|nr:DUF6290 family protein [Eubacterium sp.]MCM1419508.1 DUF6290 family protein [Roseburia sp.]MCM1463267.1 DUF6290 family protein [Bacteroides sp.]